MKKVVFFLALSWLFCSLDAQSQDCKTFFRDLLDYASKPGNAIDFKLVALAKDGKWAQFTEGRLSYYKVTSPPPFAAVTAEGLSGSAKQYFSDRLSSCGSGGWNIDYWFSKSKADNLDLKLHLPSTMINPQVTLTLKSWGNSKSTFNTVCAGGFMYLLDNGTAIVFKKVKADSPPPN